MNAEQASNTVLYLQSDPLAYRNFGVYWWWVKRELKRHGHTREQLRHLGDEHDPSCDRFVTGSAADVTLLAFAEQFSNVTCNHRRAHGWTPDGDPYYVLDGDAE